MYRLSDQQIINRLNERGIIVDEEILSLFNELIGEKNSLLRECRIFISVFKQVLEIVHSQDYEQDARYKAAIILLEKIKEI